MQTFHTSLTSQTTNLKLTTCDECMTSIALVYIIFTRIGETAPQAWVALSAKEVIQRVF